MYAAIFSEKKRNLLQYALNRIFDFCHLQRYFQVGHFGHL
jgi:hypothetical protein